MEEQPSSVVHNLGHLGLIASLFNEYKIVERIDFLLPKISNNQHVTHGEIKDQLKRASLSHHLKNF